MNLSSRESERTFAIEKSSAVLARKRNRVRKLADKLHDLRDMVFVLGVARAGLGIEEVVPASEELE